MADKKISQLTALSAANVASATDVLAIVDTSATETKKITAKDLIDGALNGGTANGVLYLNGSKVATSGSALTFDGTTVLTTPRINITNTGIGATFSSSGGSGMRVYGSSGTNQWDVYLNGANIRFSDNTGGGVVKIDTGAVIDGNLGIGTTSPGARLHASQTSGGGSVVGAYLQNPDNNTNTEVRLAFGPNDSALASNRYAWIGAINTGSVNATALTFATGPGGTAATERGRFTSGGDFYVGGMASANGKLSVRGPGTTTGYSFEAANSAGSTRFLVSDNGLIQFYKSDNNEAARFTSGGVFCVNSSTNVGSEVTLFKQTAGTGSPVTRTWNNATSGNNEFVEFATEASYTARGSITYNRGAGQVAYNITSDARLKENIADSADAGGKIDAMQVRQFDWKETGNHLDYGFVAQELHNVASYAVSKPEDDEAMWSVDYSKLVPMLVKEVQSLRKRVAELEAK